jgi:hypothetical protein
MKKISVSLLIIIFPGFIIFCQENRKVPTFEEVLSLKGAGGENRESQGRMIWQICCRG